MKKLLGEGADPNTKDHAGWTPLVSESSTVNSREFFKPGFVQRILEKIWKFAKQFSEIKPGKIVKSLEIFFKVIL